MSIGADAGLKPTLWRTCRVLANHDRLTLLCEIIRRPHQPVSELAARTQIPLPTASQYLRALNARGLLRAQRTGRWVRYRATPDVTMPETRRLLKALKRVLVTDDRPAEEVMRTLTGFTHPRRLAILKALQVGPLTYVEIQDHTGISRRAIDRHLRKLLVRGIIRREGDLLILAHPRDSLGRTLVQLTLNR